MAEINYEKLYFESQERLSLLTQNLSQTNELLKNLNETISNLQQENKTLHESVDYLMKKLYGKKSETSKALGIVQPSLFDEAEVEKDFSKEQYTDSELDDGPVRKTGKRKKKTLEEKFKDAQKQKVVYDIPEKDKVCDRCGTRLVPVGEEFVRNELDFIPAQVIIRQIYKKIYECRQCRKENNVSYIVPAKAPVPVIPHSYASASSVAEVIKLKFINGMPLYLQEENWSSIGVDLTRQTMSNWILKVNELYLSALTNHMKTILKQGPYIQADETGVQVMNEPGRKNDTKSFMWVYSTIKEDEHPIHLYDYHPSRSGDCAKEYLNGFKGYLITDAYQGYNKVPDVVHCYCWAHARRYFVDSLPKDMSSEQANIPSEAIRYIGKLFKIEEGIALETKENKEKVRQNESKKVIGEFFEWAKNINLGMISSKKLKDAINYVINQEEGLREYLNDGNIPIDNSRSERTIRKFTIGRKNWLFSGSPEGAQASANCYSIIQTAQANKIDAYKYLELIFTELPLLDIQDEKVLESYMPWQKRIKGICKKN